MLKYGFELSDQKTCFEINLQELVHEGWMFTIGASREGVARHVGARHHAVRHVVVALRKNRNEIFTIARWVERI